MAACSSQSSHSARSARPSCATRRVCLLCELYPVFGLASSVTWHVDCYARGREAFQGLRGGPWTRYYPLPLVGARGWQNEPMESLESLRAYRAEPPTSANLFAVSATMSIRRCSFFCSSGMFTLSVTR
jgi:hypothetical protein